MLLRLFIAGQHIVGAFPRRQEIEIAEFLPQFDRLVDHALDFIIVADFDETSGREVLAQRVAFKAVVGEDAAKVRMTGEQDAVEIVGFALEPVGARKHRGDRRHG